MSALLFLFYIAPFPFCVKVLTVIALCRIAALPCQRIRILHITLSFHWSKAESNRIEIMVRLWFCHTHPISLNAISVGTKADT